MDTLLVPRARVEAGLQKLLESREGSEKNARNISFLFHLDITLAEPHKKQRPQVAAEKQRCCGGPVLLVVGQHHRADAATQLVHELEQRVGDVVAAGFSSTTQPKTTGDADPEVTQFDW